MLMSTVNQLRAKHVANFRVQIRCSKLSYWRGAVNWEVRKNDL